MAEQSPLRVLIDAFALGEASGYRGIGSYQRNLLEHLAEQPTLDVAALVTDATSLPSGVRRVHLRRVTPPRFRQREHELLLPFALSRTPADVVHSASPDSPRR